MKKIYSAKISGTRFSSGATIEPKLKRTAKISLIIYLLVVIAAKSFSQCTYNAQIVAASCWNSCTGDVLFSASGGTPPYFLNISAGPQVAFTSTYLWTNACPGYIFNQYTIIDALGNCPYTGYVNVPSISQINDYIHAVNSTILCNGSNTFLMNSTSAYNYQWRLNGVNIPGANLSGYNAYVQGNYDCVVSNDCETLITNSIAVTNAPGYPAVITATGPISCVSGPVILNANTGSGLSYQWRLNGTDIAGATLSSYTATVTGIYDCMVSSTSCTSTSNTLSVFIGSPFTASVAAGGPTTFCYGNTVTLNASPTGPGYTYQWRLNGMNISGATSSSYVAGSQGNYDVVISNGCISTSNVIMVTISNLALYTLVLQPDGVNGTDAVIGSLGTQASTNYGSSAELNGLAWTVSGNPANQRSLLRFDLGALPANVSIQQATLTLYNNPNSSNGNPPGSHSALSGSNAAWLQKVISPWNENTVTWNTQPSTTSVNQVALSQSTNAHQDYNIEVTTQVQDMFINPASNHGFMLRLQTEEFWRALVFATSDYADATKRPKLSITYLGPASVIASITSSGPTTFCSPGSVTLNANTGSGLSYQWRLNGGNIAGATSSSYVANSSGNYDCIVSNNCSSSTSNIITVTVIFIPTTPGSITGQTGGVCGTSATYSIPSVSVATSYAWNVPPGSTITNGQGTTSINVSFLSTFTSGTISVTASNSCGASSASSIVVTGTPAQPGPISGPASVCKNQNNVIYSIAPVPGAVSYTWTKPPGAIFNSGQGTTSVNIKFGKKPGNVTVRANNACGSGPVRSLTVAMPCRMGEEIAEDDFEVTLYPNPATDKLNVICYTLYGNESLTIFNAVGETILKSEILNQESAINIGALPVGIYFAEIISGNQKKVVKFIKQE